MTRPEIVVYEERVSDGGPTRLIGVEVDGVEWPVKSARVAYVALGATEVEMVFHPGTVRIVAASERPT